PFPYVLPARSHLPYLLSSSSLFPAPPPTYTYTLSLHDALPILILPRPQQFVRPLVRHRPRPVPQQQPYQAARGGQTQLHSEPSILLDVQLRNADTAHRLPIEGQLNANH